MVKRHDRILLISLHKYLITFIANNNKIANRKAVFEFVLQF